MHDMKKNIRRVFWLYFAMFLMVVGYLGKFILVDSADIVNSTYNPRLNRNDFSIKRGNIYDADGNILAGSVENGGLYKRVFNYDEQYAHTVGFIHDTKAGVEAKYNFTLNNLDNGIYQRVRNLVTQTPLQGDNVHLSLNFDMQKAAFDALGSNKGGIVVMEVDTGRIITMISSPAYDPNDIWENWESLRSDEGNSPLLNRATQGLYPPGSIFKVITADSIMNNMADYENYYYECTGSAVVAGSRIQCYDGKAHGTVNLHDALKYSCNTYFAVAAMETGYLNMATSAESAMFNKSYNFDLEHVSSRFEVATHLPLGSTFVADISENAIMQTAIGQGKTLVTPLHMAMIASAIANEGVMMEPYICEKITSYSGRTKSVTESAVLTQAFSKENADKLREMLVSVVEGGTGAAAKVAGIEIAGKTGTAENSSGADHGWFIAMAPADNPRIALAVVTENSDGTRKSLSIAKTLMEIYFGE